jgi:hypothetical protein
MVPQTTLLTRTLVGAFFQALVRAVVPLLAGLVAAGLAAVAFVVLLRGALLDSFFSDAAAVGIGVLIALVVNGSLRATSQPLAREIRAGTIALSATGTLAALVGQLSTGSAVLRGIFFALTWGGMTAGVLGLVFFVRGETGSGQDPAAALARVGGLGDHHTTPPEEPNTPPAP